MNTIEIEGSLKTPKARFDHHSGELSISGRSIHENSHQFFKSLIEWVLAYKEDPAEQSHLVIDLEYYNSSSLRFLKRIIVILEDLYKSGHDVRISWYYEADDPDVMEEGLTLKDLLDVPFEVLEHETPQ